MKIFWAQHCLLGLVYWRKILEFHWANPTQTLVCGFTATDDTTNHDSMVIYNSIIIRKNLPIISNWCSYPMFLISLDAFQCHTQNGNTIHRFYHAVNEFILPNATTIWFRANRNIWKKKQNRSCFHFNPNNGFNNA